MFYQSVGLVSMNVSDTHLHDEHEFNIKLSMNCCAHLSPSMYQERSHQYYTPAGLGKLTFKQIASEIVRFMSLRLFSSQWRIYKVIKNVGQ